MGVRGWDFSCHECAKWKKLIRNGLLFFKLGINPQNHSITKQKDTMKKLLLVLAVGAFVACNNGGGEETKADTTTTINSDTTTVVAPNDTTVVVPADTTHKPDSTKK